MAMKWNEIQKQYTITATVETEWFMGLQDELGILDYERDDWYWKWKEIRLENKSSGELIVVDVSDLTTPSAVVSAVEERMSKI